MGGDGDWYGEGEGELIEPWSISLFMVPNGRSLGEVLGDISSYSELLLLFADMTLSDYSLWSTGDPSSLADCKAVPWSSYSILGSSAYSI